MSPYILPVTVFVLTIIAFLVAVKNTPKGDWLIWFGILCVIITGISCAIWIYYSLRPIQSPSFEAGKATVFGYKD